MKMNFEDTDAFYKKLKDGLSTGEHIEVITNYKKYTDLPERFRKIFETERYKHEGWINVKTLAFVPMSKAVTKINYQALYVLGGAAVGALVGFVGGPFGAAVGGALGAAAGVAAAAMASDKHDVEIEIDAEGKLKVKIQPRTPRSA